MIFFKNIFLFTFQASSVDDNAVLDDFSYDSQASNLSQASNTPVLKKRKGTSRALSTASPTPSSVSKTSDTNLKEMAVDALRAMSVPQQKDKFGAFADYIAAELRSLTPQQADYAKSKLSRAFNDIVDDALLKVITKFRNFLIQISKIHLTVCWFYFQTVSSSCIRYDLS